MTALLIELLTEELPPKALQRLSDSFTEQIATALRGNGLVSEHANVLSFATPRRLALRIDAVAERAADRRVQIKGPSTKVAIGVDGKPTAALLKWAEKQGATVASLQVKSDGKQDYYFADILIKGESLDASIGAIIDAALVKLPIPKMMQYQLADGQTTVEFVRPAHSLIVLHGDRVVAATVLGLQSGRSTHGHRFQSIGPIQISNAQSYESQLAKPGRVIASFAERRQQIAQALTGHATQLNAGLGDAESVSALLDEVTALVEWPAVYVGRFDQAFLAVPQECLILSMRTNQKYFPLFDGAGKLLPQFLIVSNMQLEDPSSIIYGNERVVRPRLADAQFFFEQDKKRSLASRVEQLSSVVYHAKLGTQAQRVERLRFIAAAISRQLGAAPQLADRAALLAKADLVTGMVGEFPELQGIMGRYYALHDGEPVAVAQAIAEQYQPRFGGDHLPRETTGTIVALTDKLETLTGLFAIGQQPTGDRDPFALRRHALGVVRLLIENRLALDLRELFETALDSLSAVTAVRATAADGQRETVAALVKFSLERLSGYLRDKGYRGDEIAAVLDAQPTQLDSIFARLDAVRQFSALPAAQALAAANKRIGNILKKNSAATVAVINKALLTEPAEQTLAQMVDRLQPQVAAHYAASDYSAALQSLAQARESVDRFFDDVMVMAPDTAVRDNRLALLTRLHQMMNQVADLSKLAA